MVRLGKPGGSLLGRTADGDIGATAEALRSGRPMLVVPFSHDQPDNGYRVRRLGAGLVLPRAAFTARRVVVMLHRLLHDSALAARAASLSARLRAEHGVQNACDAIERQL